MTYLVDTHVLLWALSAPDRLRDSERGLLEDRSNRVCYSAVSIAEIAIKASIRKHAVPDELPANVLESGFDELPLTGSDGWILHSLPFHHRDPFDRMIIAQSLVRAIPIMTRDTRFVEYGCELVR